MSGIKCPKCKQARGWFVTRESEYKRGARCAACGHTWYADVRSAYGRTKHDKRRGKA